jgi:hypothetical protein
MSASPSVPPLPPPGVDGVVGTAVAPAVRPAVLPSFSKIFCGSLVVAASFASLWCYGLWSFVGLQAWTRLGLFMSGWVLASLGCGGWTRRRGWATWRRSMLVAAATFVAGAGPYLLGRAAQEVGQSSRRGSAQPRQIAAAIDQYFLENGTSIVEYDDVVGPTRYLKSVYRVDEEDHRAMFPVHTFTPTLSLRLKDGFVVSYDQLENSRATPTQFAPAEPLYPAGARPPADGVYRSVLNHGTQLEVTYSDGVPHGSFRAYDPQGRLLGEGLYDDGLPVNPRRLPIRSGPLTGVAAIREAQAFYTRGTNRFYTGDYAGAVVRFTRSIELNPNRAGAFELRGRARLMQRDWAGAVANFWRGAALRRAAAPEPAD